MGHIMGEIDINKMSIDEIKSKLVVYNTYFQLAISLVPGCFTAPLKEDMIEFSTSLESASEIEIRERAPNLFESFEKLLQLFQGKIQPKESIEKIAFDYWILCRDKSFSATTGLPYHWIAPRLYCSALGFPEDLPYHANIGVFFHAGYVAVEEEFLLRDAFFILIKARKALEKLENAGNIIKKKSKPEHYTDQITSLNQNVSTYSRLAVYSFYSFVECFVNSVAQDFLARNQGLTEDQKIILHGQKKKKNKIVYFKLEHKIEKIPGIIRGDGKCHLLLSDPAQIKEPFSSFLGLVKDIRDATSHYNQGKAEIWRKPHEWVEIANEACKICLEVAKTFWMTCYPDKVLPIYLGGLNEKKHIEIAEQRLELEYKAYII
jgi:hypothetical protein